MLLVVIYLYLLIGAQSKMIKLIFHLNWSFFLQPQHFLWGGDPNTMSLNVLTFKQILTLVRLISNVIFVRTFYFRYYPWGEMLISKDAPHPLTLFKSCGYFVVCLIRSSNISRSSGWRSSLLKTNSSRRCLQLRRPPTKIAWCSSLLRWPTLCCQVKGSVFVCWSNFAFKTM